MIRKKHALTVLATCWHKFPIKKYIIRSSNYLQGCITQITYAAQCRQRCTYQICIKTSHAVPTSHFFQAEAHIAWLPLESWHNEFAHWVSSLDSDTPSNLPAEFFLYRRLRHWVSCNLELDLVPSWQAGFAGNYRYKWHWWANHFFGGLIQRQVWALVEVVDCRPHQSFLARHHQKPVHQGLAHAVVC